MKSRFVKFGRRSNSHNEPDHDHSRLARGTYYSAMTLSLNEWWVSAIIACSFFFGLGVLFFQHLLLASAAACVGFIYPNIRKKQKIIRRKERLTEQFQQALNMLSASLSAGRSLESSISAVLIDLKLLYPNEKTDIIREFQEIEWKLKNGIPVEKAFIDFSNRADIEDISQFVDVLVVCKRTGGNLAEVVRTSSRMIGDKFQIQQEIQVMISQKKFENRVLNLLPIGILGLLISTSSDYMAPLYEGAGRFVMCAALAGMGFCYWWSQKIMRIEV